MKFVKLIFLFLFIMPVTTSHASEVIFAGDVTLTRNIAPTQEIFMSEKAVELVETAEAFIFNIEFSGKSKSLKKKQFVFSCDSDILAKFKFTNGIGLIANNHSFDGNEEGFRNLVQSLDNLEMMHVGAHTIKFNNLYVLGYSPMIASPLVKSFEDVIEEVKNIDKQPGEYVIVCIHDGIEKVHYPSERQKKQAKAFADLGVDVICFTHSHTYIDPGIIGNTLVLWGMGNFVFGGNSSWKDRSDVRMISVNLEDKSWKWIKGYTKNYVFNITEY